MCFYFFLSKTSDLAQMSNQSRDPSAVDQEYSVFSLLKHLHTDRLNSEHTKVFLLNEAFIYLLPVTLFTKDWFLTYLCVGDQFGFIVFK